MGSTDSIEYWSHPGHGTSMGLIVIFQWDIFIMLFDGSQILTLHCVVIEPKSFNLYIYIYSERREIL